MKRILKGRISGCVLISAGSELGSQRALVNTALNIQVRTRAWYVGRTRVGFCSPFTSRRGETSFRNALVFEKPRRWLKSKKLYTACYAIVKRTETLVLLYAIEKVYIFVFRSCIFLIK
jgi:hypothetical protein